MSHDAGCYGAEVGSDPLAAEIRVLLSRPSDASALAAEIGSLTSDSAFQPGLSLVALNTIAEALHDRRWTSVSEWSMQQAGDWVMPKTAAASSKKTKRARKRPRHTTGLAEEEKSDEGDGGGEQKLWRTTLEFDAAGTPIVRRLPHNAAIFTVLGARSRKDAALECVKFALVDRPPPSEAPAAPPPRKKAVKNGLPTPALLHPTALHLRAVKRFVRSPDEGGFVVELSMEWSGATFAEAEAAVHSGYAQNFRAKIVWPNLEDFRDRHADKADEDGGSDEEEDDECAELRALEYAVRDILEQVRSIFQHPPERLCALRTS